MDVEKADAAGNKENAEKGKCSKAIKNRLKRGKRVSIVRVSSSNY